MYSKNIQFLFVLPAVSLEPFLGADRFQSCQTHRLFGGSWSVLRGDLLLREHILRIFDGSKVGLFTCTYNICMGKLLVFDYSLADSLLIFSVKEKNFVQNEKPDMSIYMQLFLLKCVINNLKFLKREKRIRILFNKRECLEDTINLLILKGK